MSSTAPPTVSTYPPITDKGPFRKTPNLKDYEATRSGFDWSQGMAGLDLLPGGGWNIAHEAVDRHVADLGDKVALRWLAKSGEVTDLTYAELSARTSRFASALDDLGLRAGNRLFILSTRMLAVHPVVNATLAGDHRVTDGHRGGLMLTALDRLLQEPEKL